MLHTFFFSPSGSTCIYAEVMTEAYGEGSQLVDLTHGHHPIHTPPKKKSQNLRSSDTDRHI